MGSIPDPADRLRQRVERALARFAAHVALRAGERLIRRESFDGRDSRLIDRALDFADRPDGERKR